MEPNVSIGGMSLNTIASAATEMANTNEPEAEVMEVQTASMAEPPQANDGLVDLNPLVDADDVVDYVNSPESPSTINSVEAEILLAILSECKLQLATDDEDEAKLYVAQVESDSPAQQVSLDEITGVCITYIKAAKDAMKFPMTDEMKADSISLDYQYCIMERLRERLAA